MAISAVQQLSAAFTDTTLPIMYRDPLINKGSLALFDFLNPYTNPNADGNLSAGATFNNLVDGGAAASILAGATAGGFANLTGKAGLALSGGNNATLDLGATYDFSVSLHPFLVIKWIKTPTTGFTSSAYPKTLSANGAASGVNVDPWAFDMGGDGKTPRVTVGTGSAPQTLPLFSGAGLGAVSQIGLAWSAGVMTLFYNGALYSSTTNSVPTTLASPTANVQFRNVYTGSHYRAYIEDIGLSLGGTPTSAQVIAQATAQIAADYAANSARFT